MTKKSKIDVSEKALDSEVVAMLSYHIDNPCKVGVDGEEKNIRDFYIREAEKILPYFKNPWAKEALQSKIEQYK